MQTFAPKDERETAEIVAAAISNETPLEVCGAGSMRGLGRPVEAGIRLSTGSMSGISMYEPSELFFRAGSGTPLRDIVNLLAQRGQELAFEPIDYGPLFGNPAMSGTIGGLVAVNAAGPRRIKAGAARDHLLGFRAVSGRGEVFQSGGTVMKNVTGYDLSKLMAGSYGTLAVLTEVTFKVLPKAPAEETLLLLGLDDAKGIGVLTEASGLPHDVSSFAHLPTTAAATLDGMPSGQSITALRLEGPPVSIAKRKEELVRHFKDRGGAFETLDEVKSKQFWASIRDVTPLVPLDADIWRISTAPTEGPDVVERLKAAVPLQSWFYDWAGGLIWLAVERADGANAAAIRSALKKPGGHATLIRAADSVRAGVPVFHPQAAPLAALTARVKSSFDPERILNRGRMREDL